MWHTTTTKRTDIDRFRQDKLEQDAMTCLIPHKKSPQISELSAPPPPKFTNGLPWCLLWEEHLLPRLPTSIPLPVRNKGTTESFSLRDRWRCQIGWIFGNVPGGGIFDPKINVADFGPLHCFFRRFYKNNLQQNFWKWGEGVKGRLEFFWKFVRFGGVIRPLEECRLLKLYHKGWAFASVILATKRSGVFVGSCKPHRRWEIKEHVYHVHICTNIISRSQQSKQ